MQYEIMCIMRPDASMSQVKEEFALLKQKLCEGGGDMFHAEYCGFRSLAYKIMKRKKAHYIMIIAQVPAAMIAELNYWLKFNRDIMRFLLIRSGDEEKQKTPMFHSNLFSMDEVDVSDSSTETRSLKREEVEEFGIDYKNIRFLQRFVSETGKIVPARMSQLSRQRQTKLALEIKKARYLAMMPYIARPI